MAKYAATLIKNDINLAHKQIIFGLIMKKPDQKHLKVWRAQPDILPPLIVRCFLPLRILRVIFERILDCHKTTPLSQNL